MKFHMITSDYVKKTPIDLEEIRSKVKVTNFYNNSNDIFSTH